MKNATARVFKPMPVLDWDRKAVEYPINECLHKTLGLIVTDKTWILLNIINQELSYCWTI